ncbi:MAG: CHASE domain-containing protein [Proteobacteria bacterium]|nr:CHASE domain-containing protein [Pseudomonadota bacterium]
MTGIRNLWLFKTFDIVGFSAFAGLTCFSLAMLAIWLDLGASKTAFDERVSSLQRMLAQQFGNTDAILTSLAGLHHSSDNMKTHEFAGQSRELLAAYPFVDAIMMANVLEPADRASMEERMRLKGFFEFRLSEHNNGAKVSAPSGRSYYLPVVVLEPFDPVNASLIGFDLLSDPALADALATAIASGQVAISNSVMLPNIGERIFVFKAFYLGYTSPNTESLRKIQTSGIIALMIDPRRFLERIVKDYSDLEITFLVSGGAETGDNRVLFAHVPEQLSTRLPFINSFSSRIPLSEKNAAFMLEIQKAPTFEQIRFWLVALLALIGAFGCGFLGLAIWQKRASQLRSDEDERVLRENEIKFRDFAEIASDLFWSTDRELKIDYSSDGASVRSVQPLQALLTGDRADGTININETIASRLAEDLSKRRSFRDIRYSCHDEQGVARWWAVSGKPTFDSNGEFCGYRGTGREVTKETEARHALIESKEEAEIANRSKSEFIANMSHELRTPLNAIIGFSEVLESERLGPLGSARYRSYATDIHNSGIHLLSLINDILDLSKVESGFDDLNEEKIDVAEVVRALIILINPHAVKGDVTLEMELEEELPLLFADERKIKQILVNILSNAIKFTPSNGRVVLKIRCLDTGEFEFQTCDNGIGMSPDEAEKALLKFGQIDSELNRKYDGTGLGLPLSKSLTELHGGILKIDSLKNCGTTVTIRLPACRTIFAEKRPSESGSGEAVPSATRA